MGFFFMNPVAPAGAAEMPTAEALKVGSNIPPGVVASMHELLGPYLVLKAAASDNITFGFGNHSICSQIIPPLELAALGPEGYIVRGDVARGLVCANGNPLDDFSQFSIGAAFAAYDVLQRMGFSFLHPLGHTVPQQLDCASLLSANNSTAPHFRFRAFHYHTEHPLEMVDVLQGADAELPEGEGRVPWSAMVPEVQSWFTWLIANRQNRAEWVLLTTPEWSKNGFVDSELRAHRLRSLTDMGRTFGLLVGADVPIIEIQQHGWYMAKGSDKADVQAADIRTRVDWLVQRAGFDYLATESGYTEFEHPKADVMLRLMNDLADYAMKAHRVHVYIKCHCSAGQQCPGYPDPRDPSRAIDFNQLPTLASKNMGVMAHTVQAYALDDPTAGAYGNTNYGDMLDWMLWEAANDTREVVYHPETNYWVNVDIDVPLFLPLYGERRLHDLHLLAERERHLQLPPGRISGVDYFDSGWEWGSWLSDVVAAGAAWDPISKYSDRTAAFRAAMSPLARALGGSVGERVTAAVAGLAMAQGQLLIDGAAGSFLPDADEIKELSGFAYLSGRDAWSDLLHDIGVATTQVQKVNFYDHKNRLYKHVAPLLSSMNASFTPFVNELHEAARLHSPKASTHPLLQDLLDAADMLLLRVRFTATLYEASAPTTTSAERDAALALARQYISIASKTVARRMEASRVQPSSRIYGWRPNPTSYTFGYVWTVKSLYYFWRDYGMVERGSLEARVGPCYLNMQKGTDVVFGGGVYVSEALRKILRDVPFVGKLVGDCIAPPSQEYQFPRDLYK
eukprot:gene21033-25239_t